MTWMDTEDNFQNGNKPDIKGQALHAFTYTNDVVWNRQVHRDRKGDGGCQGRGLWGVRSRGYCSTGGESFSLAR